MTKEFSNTAHARTYGHEPFDVAEAHLTPEQLAQLDAPKDTINHPSHYTNGKVECIDGIEAATTGLEGIEAVCTGNVLKYIWRWKLKNGIEDLKKARWYLDRLIAKVEKDA